MKRVSIIWAAKLVVLAVLAFPAKTLCIHMHLSRFDSVTFRTTIRLWHELHVASHAAYDFSHVFTPCKTDNVFVGVVVNDEIRAIARCREEGSYVFIEGIAHGMGSDEACSHLVRLLANEESVRVDKLLSMHQPRWCMAYAYHSSAHFQAGVEKCD